jgi:hypothetical protein
MWIGSLVRFLLNVSNALKSLSVDASPLSTTVPIKFIPANFAMMIFDVA